MRKTPQAVTPPGHRGAQPTVAGRSAPMCRPPRPDPLERHSRPPKPHERGVMLLSTHFGASEPRPLPDPRGALPPPHRRVRGFAVEWPQPCARVGDGSADADAGMKKPGIAGPFGSAPGRNRTFNLRIK